MVIWFQLFMFAETSQILRCIVLNCGKFDRRMPKTLFAGHTNALLRRKGQFECRTCWRLKTNFSSFVVFVSLQEEMRANLPRYKTAMTMSMGGMRGKRNNILSSPVAELALTSSSDQ